MKYLTLFVLLSMASKATVITRATADCGAGVISDSAYAVCDPGDHNLTEAAVVTSATGAYVTVFSAQTPLTHSRGTANLEANFLLTIIGASVGGLYCPYFQLEGDQRSGGSTGARFSAPGGSANLSRSLSSDPKENCHSPVEFLPFQSGVTQDVSLMLYASGVERSAADGFAFAGFQIRVYDENGQPVVGFQILTAGLAIPEPPPSILLLMGLAVMKVVSEVKRDRDDRASTPPEGKWVA